MVLETFRRANDFIWDRANRIVFDDVTANQGDANGRKMRVQVVNRGAVENLTGAGLNLAWKAPNGKGLDRFKVVDAVQGIFEISFTKGMLANVGRFDASLQLILPQGEGIIESRPFIIRNQASVVDQDSAQSTDSWTALENALSGVENLEAQYMPKLFSLESQLADTTTELSKKVKMVKVDNEGQFPAPFRVPTLTTEQMFPTARNPFNPLWAEGDTIYAYGNDNTLRKSIDKGKTWEKKGYNTYGFASYNCFLKTATGTLLNIEGITRGIQRSTNDGASWTTVFTFRTNTVPLGSQSWCIDPSTGHIYMGEYFLAPTADIKVWRSIDDGLTFQEFFTFPGELSAVGTPNRIRHIHSVQYDPFDKRIIVSTGDSTPATGQWRTNAVGDSLERLITNDMLPPELLDAARSIGVMPFPNYIAWAGDTTLQPYLFRMARSEIGKPKPIIERIYKLNSTAWFTCRASDDGSRWVFSSSNEGTSLDELVHLYAVEDEGKTVWEIGSMSAGSSGTASIQPVGTPYQGSNFYLTTRNHLDHKFSWRFRLGRGSLALPVPETTNEGLIIQSASGGYMTLPPSSEKIFHVTVAGGFGRRLFLFEIGTGKIDSDIVETGNLILIIRKRGETTPLYSTQSFSERYATRMDLGRELTTLLVTGGDTLEFVIKNQHAGATINCTPSVTFGWGASSSQ